MAIAEKIEEALAGRKGSNQYQQKVDPQKFAEAPKGESRDIAAKAVDMNRETYRQAKAVVNSGITHGLRAKQRSPVARRPAPLKNGSMDTTSNL